MRLVSVELIPAISGPLTVNPSSISLMVHVSWGCVPPCRAVLPHAHSKCTRCFSLGGGLRSGDSTSEDVEHTHCRSGRVLCQVLLCKSPCFPQLQDPRVRSHLSRQAMQGMPVRNTGSPKSAVKTRQAFFLHTTYFTKIARQVCKNTLRLRQAARRPFVAINYAAIRAECKTLFNS